MFCYSLCIVLKVLHELSWECDRLYPIPTITYSINKKINTINRNIYTHQKSSTYAFSCCKFLFSDFLITSINIHTGKTGIKKIKKTITTLQTFQPNINFNLPIDVYTKNTYMNLHTQKKILVSIWRTISNKLLIFYKNNDLSTYLPYSTWLISPLKEGSHDKAVRIQGHLTFLFP